MARFCHFLRRYLPHIHVDPSFSPLSPHSKYRIFASFPSPSRLSARMTVTSQNRHQRPFRHTAAVADPPQTQYFAKNAEIIIISKPSPRASPHIVPSSCSFRFPFPIPCSPSAAESYMIVYKSDYHFKRRICRRKISALDSHFTFADHKSPVKTLLRGLSPQVPCPTLGGYSFLLRSITTSIGPVERLSISPALYTKCHPSSAR